MIGFLGAFTSLLFDILRYDFVVIPCLLALLVAFATLIKNLIKGGVN